MKTFLSKLALAVATDKDKRKKVMYVVLIVVVMLMLPIAVAYAMSNGAINIDYESIGTRIGSNYIDTESYYDSTTKNNVDLVNWVENAEVNRWGYVYGTYGTILTEKMIDAKIHQYPLEVGDYSDYIKEHWNGRRTCDCVGLIKGYAWFDPEKSIVVYGAYEMPDYSADGIIDAATEKGTLDTIPEIPGLGVWHKGHVGVYIGNGYVIQSANTKVGVVKTKIDESGWTHWFKIPYINYVEDIK